jgi:hypothetical protein
VIELVAAYCLQVKLVCPAPGRSRDNSSRSALRLRSVSVSSSSNWRSKWSLLLKQCVRGGAGEMKRRRVDQLFRARGERHEDRTDQCRGG